MDLVDKRRVGCAGCMSEGRKEGRRRVGGGGKEKWDLVKIFCRCVVRGFACEAQPWTPQLYVDTYRSVLVAVSSAVRVRAARSSPLRRSPRHNIG